MQFESPGPHVQSSSKRSTSQFKSPRSTKRSLTSAPVAQTESPTLIAMPARPKTIIRPPVTEVQPWTIIKPSAIPVQPETISKPLVMAVPSQAIVEHPTVDLPAKVQMQVSIQTTETMTLTPRVAFRIFAICLTSIAVCVNFSNYSSLIPALRSALQIDNGQVGLFSTLLFLGIVVSNMPGGVLADRFGSRSTMLVALSLMTAGSLLFSLFPNFIWMIPCRVLVGLGSGVALVSCSHACAQLGKYEPLGQGLRGGAAQLGVGLGLVSMTFLQGLLGWRNALFACGTLSVIALIVWLWYPKEVVSANRDDRPVPKPTLAIRTPAILMLGLANMGTFGLADAIMAWINVYFINLYGLPLALAGTIGSAALFGGIFFQLLGGLLLARLKKPVLLIRIGTVMSFLSVVALALPFHLFPLAIVGLVLFAVGTTLPFAAIFSSASMAGKTSGAGAGISQALVANTAFLAAITGAPLIGLVLEHTGSFTTALGSVALVFPAVAVTASLFLGFVLKPVQRKTLALTAQ